jgi:hypothetical protein
MQYKFRGKRTDGKGWIYGSYIQRGDLHFIEVPLGEGDRIDYWMHQVDWTTVGMCTGLKDINGAEVWEGDIYHTNVSGSLYQILFVSGAFVGGKDTKSCSPLGWQPDDNGDDLALDKTEIWLSIAGNVHDNPELITPANKTTI